MELTMLRTTHNDSLHVMSRIYLYRVVEQNRAMRSNGKQTDTLIPLAMSQTRSPTQKTLSSALEEIQTNHNISPQKNHPFASGSEDSCAYLKQLVQAADQITHSLNGYLTLPWSQPKLISLLRQQSSLTSTIRTVKHPAILNSLLPV